jgi:hypothetical protein
MWSGRNNGDGVCFFIFASIFSSVFFSSFSCEKDNCGYETNDEHILIWKIMENKEVYSHMVFEIEMQYSVDSILFIMFEKSGKI